MSNTTIDFRTLPSNVPSLCIPRVFLNINEARIRNIFDSLDMGEIEKVDIITKKSEKGEKFNRVFIHFRRWNNGKNANAARERLLNGKEIKIIYDDPWFWKISAYRERERKPFRPSDEFKPVMRKPAPPRLQFEDDDTRQNNRGRKENNHRKHHHPVKAVLSEAATIEDVLSEAAAATAVTAAAATTTTTHDHADQEEEEFYHDEEIQHKEVKIDYGKIPLPKKLNLKPKKAMIKATTIIKEDEEV